MIQIVYAPLSPARRSGTVEIAAAIKALAANPVSPVDQTPGSFLIPVAKRSAALTAARDCKIAIRTRTEQADGQEFVRVTLKP